MHEKVRASGGEAAFFNEKHASTAEAPVDLGRYMHASAHHMSKTFASMAEAQSSLGIYLSAGVHAHTRTYHYLGRIYMSTAEVSDGLPR